MGTNILIPENSPLESAVTGIKTATLNDAQIKALPTTPFEVVAAPGVGKIIVPVSSFFIISIVSGGGYDNRLNASFQLVTGLLGIVSGVLDAEALIGSSNHLTLAGFPVPKMVISANQVDLISGSTVNISDYENQPIVIRDPQLGSHAGTDYTNGNAANTLKVTVYYVVVDV